MDDKDWLSKAQAAYTSSTTYFDSSIRKQINDDIRQASGKHPSGSKYLSDAYKGRSKLYRPKTRTAIRKNEAVAAAAFFSTADVVSIRPQDDSIPEQKISAEIMQSLVQYRLTKTIPWFMVCIGAYQDAMTVGVVASKQSWEYNSKKGIDRPCIDLIPVENIRIDPGAKWYDPIGTSPYVIHLIPMYVKDVKSRMRTLDQKTGQPKWKPLTDRQILSAINQHYDSTRQTREGERQDSTDTVTAITDFTIVWVHENYINVDDADFVFYTMGTQFMLSNPKPIKEIYFHGKRPIVMGCSVIETHKLYPSGTPRLTREVAAEINEIANQRIDNVKFAMNKRYFAKRNAQVDLRSLTRNVPSSVTLMNDPEHDVIVQSTPDVTSSSYQEQDRLNNDFDEVSGSFSQSSVQSNPHLNDTVGGMNLLSDGANQMSEYQLRTFSETWVEPVLRQLVLLEQYYETDDTVLAMAGKSAGLFEHFGIDQPTDAMLMQEFTINVNVGLGASNPQKQVERFVYGMNALTQMMGPTVTQRINPEEVITELFGKLGYKDGKRFFNFEDDAKYSQLEATIQDLQMQLSQKASPELVAAQVAKLHADADNATANKVKIGVESAYAAMQAAQVVAQMPQVAPIADVVMQAAGYQHPTPDGVDPNYPQPQGIAAPPVDMPTNTHPMLPADPATPGTGEMAGIETQRADGVIA